MLGLDQLRPQEEEDQSLQGWSTPHSKTKIRYKGDITFILI